MLSAVLPLGQRCFLVVFVFLNIILTRIIIVNFEESNIILLKKAVIAFSLIFFVVYMPMICKSFYIANKVQNIRFEYINQEMEKGVDSVDVPSNVNFSDDGGLRFMKDYFYYNSPGDLKINFVPYEEWLMIHKDYSSVYID